MKQLTLFCLVVAITIIAITCIYTNYQIESLRVYLDEQAGHCMICNREVSQQIVCEGCYDDAQGNYIDTLISDIKEGE